MIFNSLKKSAPRLSSRNAALNNEAIHNFRPVGEEGNVYVLRSLVFVPSASFCFRYRSAINHSGPLGTDGLQRVKSIPQSRKSTSHGLHWSSQPQSARTGST